MPIQSSNGDYYEDATAHALDRPVTVDVKPFKANKPEADKPSGGGEGFDPDSDMTVVRHGATAMNESGESADLIRGWKNVPLDENGRQQAKDVAKDLKDHDPPIDQIWTSDLDRAHDTAKEISKTTGAPITVSPNLRPWNVGDLAGKEHDTVKPILEDHINNPDKVVPGGESFNTFKERAIKGTEEAMAATPGEHLAIVTHHRVERLLNSWQKKGQPDSHEIDPKEMMKKGEETGTAQVFHFDKKPIEQLNQRFPFFSEDTLQQADTNPPTSIRNRIPGITQRQEREHFIDQAMKDQQPETEMRKARAEKFFQNLRNTWPVRGAEEGLRIFSGILQNFQDVYEGRVDPMAPESIERMTDAAMMFGTPGSNVTKIPRGVEGRELTKSAMQSDAARIAEDVAAAKSPVARAATGIPPSYRPGLSREDMDNIIREHRNASPLARDLEQQPYRERRYDPAIEAILNRPENKGTKFNLEKNAQFTSDRHEEYYIKDEHGRNQGSVGIGNFGDGHYYLSWIGGGGPQALGTAGTRQIARQFFAEHPDARTLSANRVSGARSARGGADVRYSIKDGKLVLEKNRFKKK